MRALARVRDIRGLVAITAGACSGEGMAALMALRRGVPRAVGSRLDLDELAVREREGGSGFRILDDCAALAARVTGVPLWGIAPESVPSYASRPWNSRIVIPVSPASLLSTSDTGVRRSRFESRRQSRQGNRCI